MMPDWSNLPRDIIRLIFERLQFVDDIYRYAFVCHSWRSIALETFHPLDPMLVLSYDEDAETCNFYSCIDKKIFKLHLPQLKNKWCCGTSNGWLVTADNDMVVALLHPFSKAEVTLPPFPPPSPRSARHRQDAFEAYEKTGAWKCLSAGKLISSSSPLNPECVFVIIRGMLNMIYFCRSTDETWTEINYNEFSDVVCYGGKFLAACSQGRDIILDISSKTSRISIRNPEHRRFESCTVLGYFVESSGDLLKAFRHVKYFSVGHENITELQKIDEPGKIAEDDEVNEEEEISLRTIEFEVFKLTDDEANPWERVTCLGDRALFLGRNQSFSLSVAQFPAYKVNHIYFTDDSELASCHHDMGEFNLEIGSITLYEDLEAHVKHWQPIWHFIQH